MIVGLLVVLGLGLVVPWPQIVGCSPERIEVIGVRRIQLEGSCYPGGFNWLKFRRPLILNILGKND